MSAAALPRIEIPAGLGVALGVVVLGGAALWWLKGLIAERGALGAGEYIGQAIADAPAGVILGIGDSLGVPRTSESECDRALREGRTWDASFACPALRFIREGLFGSAEPNKPSSAAAPGYASGVWL